MRHSQVLAPGVEEVHVVGGDVAVGVVGGAVVDDGSVGARGGDATETQPSIQGRRPASVHSQIRTCPFSYIYIYIFFSFYINSIQRMGDGREGGEEEGREDRKRERDRESETGK